MADKDKFYDYNSRSKTLTFRGTNGAINWIKDGKKGFYEVTHLVMQGPIKVEENTFKGCKSLESIKSSGSGGIRIFESAFENCKNLREVIMPGVSLIGKKAFKNCKIMKLDISGVKKIKEEAFAGGIDTTITLNLPNVTNIGKDAFEGCSIGEMNGLEKLQDKNDLMESGCPVRFFQDDNLSSKIKQLHKKSRDLSDERKDAIYNDYKEFKIACKSFSKPYARCGQMLIRILKEMGKYFPLSNEWAEVIDGNHLGIGSKVKFDDFENEVINPLIKCSNNVMNSENKAQLDDAVEGMKKFQNSLKLYVSEKYVKLIRLNVKEAALSQAYGEYFRVLLSIAGVKKFKKIQGDNLASKTYSSYKLGGGLDLLIGVKEHQLESKKN